MDSKVSDKIGRLGFIDGGDYPMQAAHRPHAAPKPALARFAAHLPRAILSLTAFMRLPSLRACPFDAAQRCA